MAEFPFTEHRIHGNSDTAASWVQMSSLPAEDKTHLLAFIQRFSTLTFFHEDDLLLDHIEASDRVKLPLWFREMRKVLAFIASPLQARFDDYDHLLPGSDDVEDTWYRFDLGYGDDEQRELFFSKAGCYPIGDEFGTGYSYLAINLWDDNDRSILEFASENLLDNILDGKPARASVRAAFDSYARMLSRIVELRPPGDSF